MSKYDIEKIRQQVKNRLKMTSDPTEFRPGKVTAEKPLKYRFFVLPPISIGSMIDGGKMSKSMEEFFVIDGAHYINNKWYGCPRLITDGSCNVCNYGFELMGETDDKDIRAAIRRKLLSYPSYKVNIYFTVDEINPEDLRGKVKWYNATKTVFDKWFACLTRDDCGDDLDPQPFGVFFDEDNSYLFQLEISKKGDGNNYEQSKFIPKPRPIAKSRQEIDRILAQRHNLFDKVREIDADGLELLVNQLRSNDSGNSGGFDYDESATQPSKAKAPAPRQTASKPAVVINHNLSEDGSTEDSAPPEPEPEKVTKRNVAPKSVAPAPAPEPETETESEPEPEIDPDQDVIDDVDEEINNILEKLGH